MNDMTQPEPQVITVAAPTTQLGEVSGLLAQARAFQVVDQDTATIAAEELHTIKQRLATVEEERVKITKPLHEAKKNTDALFAKLSAPLEAAEREYKLKIRNFQEDQERKRREEAAKAEAASRIERERLEKEAAKLEKKGKVEEAEAKREVAAMMPTTVAAAPIETVAGTSLRANWKAEVTDKAALIRFVAEHPEWAGLLDVNTQACTAQAKAHKAKLSEVIPGLRGFNDVVVAVR